MRYLLLAALLVGCAGSPYARRKAEEKEREAARADWSAAAQVDTVEGWLAYHRKYEGSRPASRAYERALQLAYIQTKGAGTAESYESFLRQFPKGKEAEEIRTALETMRFEDAERAGTPEAYRRFAQAHPEAKQAVLASTRANRMVLSAELKSARTYSVAVAITGPDDFHLSAKQRASLARPIAVVLESVGLSRATSGRPDVLVRIEARLRWVGQSYGLGGLANKSYRVPDAGATLEGFATVRSANAARSREFRSKAKPPTHVQVRKGGVMLLGPHGDDAVAERLDAATEVCRVVTQVFGVNAMLAGLDERARNAATKEEREAAVQLKRRVRG